MKINFENAIMRITRDAELDVASGCLIENLWWARQWPRDSPDQCNRDTGDVLWALVWSKNNYLETYHSAP